MGKNLTNIDHIKKIVYIHIPKTGGTTIEKIFFNKNSSSEHITITEYSNYYDYFIFSFVRNPYTRIISVYNYFINGGNKSLGDKNIINRDVDINNFLKEYNETNLKFLKTQYSYLQDSKNIDFVGRYENFDNDLKQICNSTNTNFIDVHYRVTPYKDYSIEPEFIDMISSIYDIDFIKFNYKKIKIDAKISLAELNTLIQISETNAPKR
jgi:hypothetical protein